MLTPWGLPPACSQVRVFSGKPGHKAVAVLRQHTAEVTAVAWAPAAHHEPADHWGPEVQGVRGLTLGPRGTLP